MLTNFDINIIARKQHRPAIVRASLMCRTVCPLLYPTTTTSCKSTYVESFFSCYTFLPNWYRRVTHVTAIRQYGNYSSKLFLTDQGSSISTVVRYTSARLQPTARSLVQGSLVWDHQICYNKRPWHHHCYSLLLTRYSPNAMEWKSTLLGVTLGDHFVLEWKSTPIIVESTLKRVLQTTALEWIPLF